MRFHKNPAAAVAALLFGAGLSCVAVAHSLDPVTAPIPGTRIERFEELEPGAVYRGSFVKYRGDFDFLVNKGIRSLVSLRGMPFDVGPERRRAYARGLHFFDAPFEALPIEPSEQVVNFALDEIGNPVNQPVYFHCKLGRDRTGMIAALYRVIYQGWSPAEAHAEWEHYGFNHPLMFRGLERYFEQHVDPILYWRRHPVLRAIPGFSPSDRCASVANARGGKEVLCQLNGESIPARALLK